MPDFSHCISLVPLSLTHGWTPFLCCLRLKIVMSFISASMNPMRSVWYHTVLRSRPRWTLDILPRPADTRQPLWHCAFSANAHTLNVLPSIIVLKGLRYMIPVMYSEPSPFTVLALLPTPIRLYDIASPLGWLLIKEWGLCVWHTLPHLAATLHPQIGRTPFDYVTQS